MSGQIDRQELDALREFVHDSLGDAVQIEDFSRSYGRRSVLWRLKTRESGEYYLKRHEHRPHYEAEVHALREWVRCIASEPWWAVPAVVEASDEIGAVIMTGLPGLILDDSPIESSPRAKLYELAGRFASLLHSSHIDLSAVPRSQTYTSENVDGNLRASEPFFDSTTMRWVDSVLRSPDAWEELDVVPIHCDFSPRNWVVLEEGAALGIIDWERSRKGYWLEDFQRMVQDQWLPEPRLRDAFFTGYGREPSEVEWRQVNQIVLINALGGVPWAISHSDFEFAERNRAVIERLKKVL